ncbi:MAG: SurA N-terminal domain-containing protein [Xanthobacteraceae bacterium]
MGQSIDLKARCVRVLAAAITIVAATIGAAIAQNVVVFVNGEPITAMDVEQRSKFLRLSAGNKKVPSRQEVLDQLIDEKLKVKEAKRWGIEASKDEIDRSYSSMAGRMRFSSEQLTKSLANSGVNSNTLKAKIKADIVWQQLIRGRYQSRLQLSDSEVMKALAAKNSAAATAVSFEYTMRPILLLVPPGSSSAVYDGRRREAEALRKSFRGCRESLPALRAARDVAVRDQVVRSSGDLPEALRKLLDGIPIGQMTPPEITKHGIEMFAICAKNETKADSPGKRETRDEIFAKRFERESERYLQKLRRAALIERR